jgi:hypothetical protein
VTADQLAAISFSHVLSRRPALLTQLMLAERSRVLVPRTIITTDLASARSAFGCPRLVVKAVGEHFVEARPGRLTGVFATIVDQDEPPAPYSSDVFDLSGFGYDALPAASLPVVVQEYIEHEAELRVYYVAGEVHAFEVSKDSPAAPWTSPERVRVRPVAPPAAVEVATRVLAAAMSLCFGAFDFLVRDGAPVFLEVNPDGDWRWAERESRTTAVTHAAARMLAERHHALRQAMPGPADHRARPLDLLGFLSGNRLPKTGDMPDLPPPRPQGRCRARSPR